MIFGSRSWLMTGATGALAVRCAVLVAMAFLMVMTAGCATLSEGQCMVGDWYAIGKRDGASGRERARLFKHRQACREYGTQPDVHAYDAGRQAGLMRYCTPYQGFIEGNDGHRYRGVCPLAAERRFLPAYLAGKSLHDARVALADVERKIDALQGKFDDEKTRDKERKRLRHELRDLSQRRRHRKAELARLEYRYRRPASRWR